MANEPFDPKTATVEQLAAYARQVQRARACALVAGVVGFGVGLWLATHYDLGWMAIVVVVLAAVGPYRGAYELLKPAGANIKTD
jgi:hypothetical protein